MTDFKHLGFTVTEETPLPELQAVLYRMTHEKTGLELVWINRDEENKTFGIAFETLPWNDTGVFHILEHSVLCGSDKYPVKEPFVELMKSSLNTFLNALTFQDKTFYPISSRNDKDFLNLTKVYLDAVFRPLIYTKPEIFHQEGWHYEFDENGDASYKGVVFNEMKGVFASADELSETEMNRLLFPDTPYRFVSGGDPVSIPELSYEEFVDSHRRFYSPSNAYVFLDGAVDIEAVLELLDKEYLCDFEKTERMAPPAFQKPVEGKFEGFYELAPGEEPDGKTRLSFGKVIGSFDEREKTVATQVLADVLCGSNQAPLSKAVLGEGLAEDVTIGVNDGMLQPWLSLNVKNLRDEDADKVKSVIRNKLEELATDGLDHEQVEAVMANFEFKLRERDYGTYPQGLIFGFSVLESWLYGGDPALNLQVGDLFDRLKEKMKDGYFEKLIKEIFLDNPHSAEVVLRPSHAVGEERRAAEQARLSAKLSKASDTEIAELRAKQERLLAWQNSEDTPETLETIPQLTLEDIPSEPDDIITEFCEISGLPVISHEVHTGGIAYVSLYFDADGFSEEELSVLSFSCGLLGESKTEKRSADDVINKIRLLCGNFDAFVAPTVVGDLENVKTKLCVTFSAVESKLDDAVALISEIITSSLFDEEDAHDILRQAKMGIFQRTVMSGNAVGANRVFAQISPAGVAEEHVSGISFYSWLKNTDENWDFAKLDEKMHAVLSAAINRKTLTVSISGVGKETMNAAVEKLANVLPERPVLPKADIRAWGKRKEGIVIPADISFAVVGGKLENSGTLQLASQILTLSYLWNVVRVQGGAYGVGMLSRNSGYTSCHSYRDPNGAASVERYRETADFLRDFSENDPDLTGFIIGTVANDSPLLTPKMKARVSDSRYLSGLTFERRLELRRQLLNATPKELYALADDIEKVFADGGICLVGGKEQVDACKELEEITVI